jgi:hypothetical protein
VSVSKFLSEEWMLQARAIEAEFSSKGTPPPVQTRINLHITEVPDALSTDDLAACLDTTGGAILLDLGSFDDADATITLGYDTAQSFLVEGNQQAMMQAFMGGKIKITGDMTKVLALAAGGPDEVAVAVQARLREITD